MAEKIYGFDESKSKVEVPDKATYDADISALESGKVDKSTQSAKDSEQDTSIATAQSTADGKQDPIVAGTGISIGSDGKTINHSNSITAKTSYVGSATAVPRLKFDAQGHITGVTTATIYPPTSAGTSGQVWVSDGSGAGSWQTLASGKKELYTGTLASLITRSGYNFTVAQEFDIEYLFYSSSGYLFVSRTTVSAGVYVASQSISIGWSPININDGKQRHGYIFYSASSSTPGVRISTYSSSMSDVTISQSTSTTVDEGGYRLYV